MPELKCPLCHEPLTEPNPTTTMLRCPSCQNSCTREQATETPTKESAKDVTAALLSVILPGAGQMVRGNVPAGLMWLGLAIAGYLLLIVPGLIVHAGSVLVAYNGTHRPEKNPIPNSDVH